MKSEMDLLQMDERQRLAWLLANRGTVMAVGATWIAMIVWELVHDRAPTFLIVMVPVFALLRVGLFAHYCGRPLADAPAGPRRHLAPAVKLAAAVLLVISALLPLYSVGEGLGEVRHGYAWRMARDPANVLPLAVVYLWPLLTILLSRRASRRVLLTINQVAEPLLAAFSTVLILWIPQFIFELRPFFLVLQIPVRARPDWGCILAVVANGLYFVAWLSEHLFSWEPLSGDATD